MPEQPSTGRGARNVTFRRQISTAFALIAAVTALLAAFFIAMFWSYQFNNYLRDNLRSIADGVSSVVAEVYPMHGGWTLQTLSYVPRFGAASGIGVQILDQSGVLLYDDTTGYHGTDTTQRDRVVLAPKGPVVTSPVMVGDQQVGIVRIWALGPGMLFTDRDLDFRRGSFIALAVAALLAIVLASIAGRTYSERLAGPIRRITETASQLRAGAQDARTGLDGDDEISVLGKTFDSMADAIQADREQERRLTADVAHELRTPLMAIQATVEAMQDGVLPADEERLGVVRDETVRLARLADGILELTRLERGSQRFEMVRIDPAVPVRSAVDAQRALYEAKELMSSIELEEGLSVIGDADRLHQAIGNLLSNAARYTPPGGRVDVTLERVGENVAISVADTGIGISDEDMEHVFSRFWRADTARARSTGGIGIGLAVTREIIDRHGGTITVERRAEGGSRFTVLLPSA